MSKTPKQTVKLVATKSFTATRTVNGIEHATRFQKDALMECTPERAAELIETGNVRRVVETPEAPDAEAEARAKAEADAKEKAEAEAKEKADAKAKAEAEKKSK